MEYVLNKGRGGKGAVILFAAGNGNEDTANDGYASYPGVIAVAACNDSGTRCVYSDYGKAVWVSFPSADYGWRAFQHPAPLSEGLRTTDRQGAAGYTGDNYVNSFGGTSAACPGMAGIVALMLAANPELGPKDVKELIRKSCVVIDKKDGEYDSKGHSPKYGYGRIDAGLAIENALKAAQPAASGGAAALEGSVQFQSGAALPLKPGVLIGADFKPVKRVLGFSLGLKPQSSKLKLYCQVNTSSDGIVETRDAGTFVGTTNKRRRIMGFALTLEGSDAAKYDLQYSARLKGRKTLAKAKNGKWCGTNKKRGRTVEALSVLLKAK
jgi:subtilisin family serine protease